MLLFQILFSFIQLLTVYCYYIPPKMKFSGMTFTNGVYCPNISFASPIAYDSLKHIKSMGTNWISIVVTQFQMQHNSTDIFPIYNKSVIGNFNHTCYTSTQNELIAAINYSHSLGLNVMLKPHVDLINDPNYWRGTIGQDMNSTFWNQWFQSYTKYILFYATIAQNTHCEMLSVSTELIIASQQEALWRELIPKIRNVYSFGKLICSAHWSWPNNTDTLPTNGSGELTDKRWWDLMDIIGADEYYMNHVKFNTSYPSLTQYLNAWAPIQQQFINMNNYWNKTMVVTEIGICSGFDGSCGAVNGNSAKHAPTNQSLYGQVTLYESVLIAFTNYSFFEGIFFWNWNTDNAFGGLNNSCITPAYKPAEDLLREWYYATEPKPFPPNYKAQCECWL
eukprot:86761_1